MPGTRLIPDCWYVPDKLRTGASNLGSVATGIGITAADPWSIGDIGILDNNQLANGPGIRERNLWQEMVQKVLEY